MVWQSLQLLMGQYAKDRDQFLPAQTATNREQRSTGKTCRVMLDPEGFSPPRRGVAGGNWRHPPSMLRLLVTISLAAVSDVHTFHHSAMPASASRRDHRTRRAAGAPEAVPTQRGHESQPPRWPSSSLMMVASSSIDDFSVAPPTMTTAKTTTALAEEDGYQAIKVRELSEFYHSPPVVRAVVRASSLASPAPSTPAGVGTGLNTVETWCRDRLDAWYCKAERVRCPFFRRRYSDALDHLETWLVRPLLVRPSTVNAGLFGPSQACKPANCGEGGGRGADGAGRPSYNTKSTNLPLPALMDILRRDWQGSSSSTLLAAPHQQHYADDHPNTHDAPRTRGYYVTGRLSTSIYRDDCIFESPDPDLPIRGLRKYVGVASQLFDSRDSFSQLVSLEQVNGSWNDRTRWNESYGHSLMIRATWKMDLTIKLPWRPRLPTFSGTTTYYLDPDHLIYRHEETWDDISVPTAFLSMFAFGSEPATVSQRTRGGKLRRLCPLSPKLSGRRAIPQRSQQTDRHYHFPTEQTAHRTSTSPRNIQHNVFKISMRN
jgi:hypothetical protein